MLSFYHQLSLELVPKPFFLFAHFFRSEIKRQSQDYSPSASDSASNREYDNVRAFDNLGYSYSTAQPYQKPASVEDLSSPTEIKVEEKSYL